MASDARPHVVLVEDDKELAEMIQTFLSDADLKVSWVSNGLEGVEHILEQMPDLVILDIMLPGIDGLEVCRRIRGDYSNPILMLTAKDDDFSEVTSLNRGADGYLNKPVHAHVLLAHVTALLRRSKAALSKENLVTKDSIRIQDLEIRPRAFEAVIDGRMMSLSTAELELLIYLAQHQGEIVSRDQLYRDLRGLEYDGLDRSIDMRISTLREKLNDAIYPYRYIKTVRGKGYLLAS